MTESPGTPSDIYPCITYEDAADAIDWLCEAFGFHKRLVVPGPDGQVMHSELTLGSGVVMVSSPRPETNRYGPKHPQGAAQTTSVCVADPDAHYAASVAAGAIIVQPLKAEEYGAKGYLVEDCEGHHWYFGDYRPGRFWDGATT